MSFIVSNYASNNDPGGNTGAANDWYGPRQQDTDQWTTNYEITKMWRTKQLQPQYICYT